ncbi:MAG TPA: hypothetical protein VL866_24380 [Pyrinomonadaceae bacterium]|jgi:hypothetical protein|nr:hypothetical protein [Pyrinomonadaceae bacterium]
MADTLKERLQEAFKDHVEKDHGLIAGPDRLLERVLKSVGEWLETDEEQWRDTESEYVAEALRDLRVNQLR